ncbi:hypothetical protein AMECASPLE_036841 [Ameca splendens]|uniref:LRAT domain-containing protein n=1 Tax=Ameca splendens TaxID=208324 RepID=A0ABV0ZTL0_9TELE
MKQLRSKTSSKPKDKERNNNNKITKMILLTSTFSIFKSENGDEPKPGDLIEIFRNVYEHWAVYVGEGYVVHLLGPDGSLSSSKLAGTTRSYNIVNYNCEHFAIELRFGNAESEQVGPTMVETKTRCPQKTEFGTLGIRVCLNK